MIFNYYSPQNPVRSVDNGNITNPVLIQRSNLTLHNIWNGSEYTTVSYKNLLNTERCSFYEVTDSNIAYNGEAPYEIAGYSYVERVLPTESGFDNSWKSLINYECCRDTNIFNIYNPIVDENGNVREAIDRDLYAVYKLKSFDVAWVVGGETIGTEKVDYGSCPTIAISDPNPTDAGLNSDEYKFMGWEASDDGTVTTNYSIYPIKQNTNFTAYFSNTTVSFVTDSTQTISKVWISKADNSFTPPIPTDKDGYTFDGWYTDSNFSTQFTDGTAVTESIILYAKWIQVPHTLTIKEFSSGDTLGTTSTTAQTVSLNENLLSNVGAVYPTVAIVANRYLGNSTLEETSDSHSFATSYDSFYSSQSDTSPTSVITLDEDKTVYVKFKYNLNSLAAKISQNSCAGFYRQGWSSTNDFWTTLNSKDVIYNSADTTFNIYEFWKACIVFTCLGVQSLINPDDVWDSINDGSETHFRLQQYSNLSYNSFTISPPSLTSAICNTKVRLYSEHISDTTQQNVSQNISGKTVSFNGFIYGDTYMGSSVAINISDHINKATTDGYVAAYASWKLENISSSDSYYFDCDSGQIDVFGSYYSPASNYIVYSYANSIKSISDIEIEYYSSVKSNTLYSSANGEFKIETVFVPQYNICFDRNSEQIPDSYLTIRSLGKYSETVDSVDRYTYGEDTITCQVNSNKSFSEPADLCVGVEQRFIIIPGEEETRFGVKSNDFMGWYYDKECTKKCFNTDLYFPKVWKIKDSNGNWTEVECQPGATYTLYAGWNFS